MTKKELALKYWDGPLPNDMKTVTNRLMSWVHNNKELMTELLLSGYDKHSHKFTPKQINIIYKYLGEP